MRSPKSTRTNSERRSAQFILQAKLCPAGSPPSRSRGRVANVENSLVLLGHLDESFTQEDTRKLRALRKQERRKRQPFSSAMTKEARRRRCARKLQLEDNSDSRPQERSRRAGQMVRRSEIFFAGATAPPPPTPNEWITVGAAQHRKHSSRWLPEVWPSAAFEIA
eukprot:Skav227979  [mRNA]  locus=scaffold1165:108936:111070:+ [translate_table: standard]